MQNKEIEEALKMLNSLDMGDDIEFIKARKTILQYIKQLKNKVEELEKENNKLTYARDWYFENTVNKTVTPEMLHKILRTKYIGRDKIENKIKELKSSGGSNGKDEIENQIREFTIEVLQELLEEK